LVHLPAAVLDAAGDDVTRYAAPAADITGVSVSQETGEGANRLTITGKSSDKKQDGGEPHLHLRVTTRGRVSPRVQYLVSLFASPVAGGNARGSENQSAATRTVALNVPLRATGSPFALEATVPLSELGLAPGEGARLWIGAETRLGGRLLVDNLGYRTFRIGAGAVTPETRVAATGTAGRNPKTSAR